jgi:hypothetical protein
MRSPENIAIVDRFFESLEALKAKKQIRGKATFCKLYGINRRNLHKLENDHSSLIFEVCWLSHLVSNFGVSADWLLSGSGDIFINK